MANPFFDTPKTRRLRQDLAEMNQLLEESSILSFEAKGPAPEKYKIHFDGRGLQHKDGNYEIHWGHDIVLDLGSEYPRTLPQIEWKTPIAHPNISGGRPCFGTFVMNPRVKLTEVVEILWDMARMSTYNPYGGYGEKDQWQVLRKELDFPVDKRILRDKLQAATPPGEQEEGGDVDLIIMDGARRRRAGLPLSQEWVKKALSQYFESRFPGMRDQVTLYTADEWNATGHPLQVENSVGTLVFGEELDQFLYGNSPRALAFQENLWNVFVTLGVFPHQGAGNILPLLPMRF